MRYLVERLREPGTMRSLAVVLFGLYGIAPDDWRVQMAIHLAIATLGLVSAAMKEPATAAAAALSTATSDARESAAVVATVVGEARSVTAQAAQVLASGRSLVEGVASGAVIPVARP